MKDAACLHIVHISQHRTSCPTTKSTETGLFNAPKMIIPPHPADKHSISTKHFTRYRHHANEGKSSLEAGIVRALGALCSLKSRKQLAVEQWADRHFSSNHEIEKWIKDYDQRETAVARKQIYDVDKAIKNAQTDMRKADNAGLTTKADEKNIQETMVAIRDSQSDLASSEVEEDREDEEDEDTLLGKPSDNDEPGWVMGKISKMVCSAWRGFGRCRWSLTNWHN